MSGEKKLQLGLFYATRIKKELSKKAAVKEMNNAEDPRTVYELVAQTWLRPLKEDDTSLEDKRRSGRPFVMKDEALLERVEQQPSTITRTLLAKIDPSQHLQHLHKLSLVNRRRNISNTK